MTNNIAPLILVVDDEAGFLEIMQAKLESQGFRVAGASDGIEAEAKARQLQPAMILMDVEMPHKDGISAAKELADDPRTKNIPIIFTTNLRRELVESLASGASLPINTHNYFRKDDDYGRLMTEIRQAVAA